MSLFTTKNVKNNNKVKVLIKLWKDLLGSIIKKIFFVQNNIFFYFTTDVLGCIYKKIYDSWKLFHKLVVKLCKSKKILDLIYGFRCKPIQNYWNAIFFYVHTIIDENKSGEWDGNIK